MRLSFPATLRSALVLALAAPVSGCVAALVPLAAGAVVGKTQLDPPGQDRPEPPIEATAQAGTTDRAKVIVAPGADYVVTDLKALPAPGATARPAPGSDDGALVDRFVEFTKREMAPAAGLSARRSAMLLKPEDLDAQRAKCGGKPPAVLVDLDRGYGVFDPYTAGPAHPLLGQALDTLRGAGLTVFWSTRLGDTFAVPLREVLVQTGLDPDGNDRLLVMHSLDERKQTRREDAARSHCVLAILGDERGDFDELYLYLRDPEAPVATDRLIGDGWFLIDPFPSGESDG